MYRDDWKFKNGTPVTITSGRLKGEKGVVVMPPNPDVGRYSYVVTTESFILGDWIDEKDMERLPYTEENISFRDKLLQEKVEAYTETRYVPADMSPYKFFTEMAKLNEKYNIRNHIKNGFEMDVEFREGSIPHVHVIYPGKKKGSKPTAYICLGKAEYLKNHDSYILNSKERKALQLFFEDVYYDNRTKMEASTWMQAVRLWSQGITDDAGQKAFNKYMVDPKTGKMVDMPDYTKLRK